VSERAERRLAYFVTPHGFGHATRACAVMQALRQLDPLIEFDIYGRTPRWLFEQSLSTPSTGVPQRYHALETDVGLRQVSALEVDVEATIQALGRFLPFDADQVRSLSRGLREGGCRGVLCDVSPLGIECARVAGLPSFLIENFTWDWIYEPMLSDAPGLQPAIERLREIYRRATWRIQTEPVCHPLAEANLRSPPVARLARRSRDEARKTLGIDGDEPVVLVTLGGMDQPLTCLEELRALGALRFVVTGAPATGREDNLVLYDNATPLYMPDLIRAADAVVAKLGYSTVAEVWHEGRPLAYIARSSFRETPCLARFVDREIPGFAISDREFRQNAWIERIEELLARDAPAARASTGARTVARFVVDRLAAAAAP
jgi:hypothetical protein